MQLNVIHSPRVVRVPHSPGDTYLGAIYTGYKYISGNSRTNSSYQQFECPTETTKILVIADAKISSDRVGMREIK